MRLKFYIVVASLLFSISSFARVEYDEVENLDQSIDVPRISADDITVEVPSYVTKGNYGEIKLKFVSATHPKLVLNDNIVNMIINGADVPVVFTNGEAIVPIKFDGNNKVSIYVEDFSFEKKITVVSTWMFYAPLVIILIAVIVRRRRKKN